MAQLKLYGAADRAQELAKVGKSKTPSSLMRRMPSPDVAAKVGEATVGQIMARNGERTHRVSRLNARKA